MKKLLAILALAGAMIVPTAWAADAASAPAASAAKTASAPAAKPASAAVATASGAAAKPASAAAASPAAAAIVDKIDKGDTAWLLVSSAFVILMSIPGLALFYGGLVRTKNMLSLLMQVFAIFSVISVLWVIYGYSLAFTPGSGWSAPFIGGFSRLMLAGTYASAAGPGSTAATFSVGVGVPELAFVVFQGAFAAITVCLIVGSFAERMKFSAVMLFSVIWFTFAYCPVAHMVWCWAGPDAYVKATDAVRAAADATGGFMFQKGALDFAGGTVVHINAAVAGLIGAFFVGKRVGLGKEAMTPHSATLTMVGASLLWFGWFGFNAGSALEANGTAAAAFVNTWVATALAGVAWSAAEWLLKCKPSMVGAASGAVAGLVAITPACGYVGLGGAMVVGAAAGFVCLWGVHGLKKILRADDALDVFGVHGVGGMLGALLTGVFASAALGGTGTPDLVTGKDTYVMSSQVLTQFEGICMTVLFSGVVSIIAYKLVDLVIGLRVTEEEEREGLDVSSHGEKAYNM